MTTAQQIINRAKAEVGVTEYPPNSNNVKYNTWYYGHPVQDGTPKGRKYPYCCAGVAWLFRDAQHLCKKTASSSDLYRWFQSRGQIVKDPRPGDIVFFKWDTKKDCIAEHVGLVIDVNGNVKTTVEFNTSTSSNDNGGKVMIRKRTANIVGYARPAYDSASESAATTPTTTTTKKTVDEVAREVIKGKWGTGAARRTALTNAGYNYAEVQNRVNQILKGK
jgi:cell wall-associated NlpC family hydrolase